MLSVTALILTFNEQTNIGRTLAALAWVERVLIVDSGSTDATLETARCAHPSVTVIARDFDSFAQQCNFGLGHVSTEWVLSIDADYILMPELGAEIRALTPPEDVAGYVAEFNYCIYGHRLRSTLYPPRTVLYRRQRASYRDEGHGHRVHVEGRLLPLRGKIDHDDRKSLSHWLRAQDQYSTIEARHLWKTPNDQLNRQDRLRKRIYFAPAAIFLYLLFGRGLVLDGWPGWYYVMQRTIAEMLLSLRLLTEQEGIEKADS